MILTEAQRLVLKTNSPESKLYLSIYKPTTLLACRVNMATPEHGAVAITFDGVTAGAYTNVFKWATVLVGTSAGKDDIGTIWARSCTSTVLTVGMNSIHWANDYYITVLNFVDVWNRPFSLSLEDDEIVYAIDGDTAFTSEDIELGTFIKMGGNYAGFVGDQVNWNASGSVNVADNTVDYVWEFEGGDVSTHSGSVVGNVTYNTAGHYKTKLTATSSNGHVNISYRYVSIYDRLGANAPYEFVGSENFSGSREEGGWVVDSWIGEDEVPSIIRNTPAIVFARHNFGGTESDLFKIMFSGYVIEKGIRYNHLSKMVECLLGSGSEVMKLRPMTAVSVDSANTAVAWTQVTEMTVKKFLYYYLNYYSTALACFDVVVDTGFDTYTKYYETSNSRLFENIIDIVNKAREGNAVFSRSGIMYVEREPKVVEDFSSTVDETFGLEDSDYLEEVYIEESLEKRHGSLQIGGFSFSGLEADDTTPLLSQAPDADYIFYSGDFSDKQGYAVDDQSELNQMAGSIYANDNAKYKNVEVTLFPLYLNFDIAPLESIPVSVSSSKNNAGISWASKKFYCREMSLDLYNEILSLVVKLILHEIVSSTYIFDGETIEIPEPMIPAEPGIEIPDFEDYDWADLTPGDWNYNPPFLPPEPIEVPIDDPEDSCPTDAPENSFSASYGATTILNGIPTSSIKLNFPVVLRSSLLHTHSSQYEINCYVETKNELGIWVKSDDDDFYEVYAKLNGGLVATGVKDAVSNLDKRTGTFSVVEDEEIDQIEIKFTLAETMITDVTDPDGNATHFDWGDLGNGLGIWAYKRMEYSQRGNNFATNWVTVAGTFPAGTEILYRQFGNVDYAGSGSDPIIDYLKYVITNDPTVLYTEEVDARSVAYDHEEELNIVAQATSLKLGVQVKTSGSVYIYNTMTHSGWLYFYIIPGVRMVFNSFKLMNVCPVVEA